MVELTTTAARATTHDVFILYSRADEAWVRGYLLDALQAADVRTLTSRDFVLGAPALRQFEQAIVASRWVVIVISHAYLADFDARFVEVMAQQYGTEAGAWPVIPVLLEEVRLPPALAILTGVRATTREEEADAIARLCQTFQAPPPAARPAPACPYPGMRAYRLDDDKPFYGRTAEVESLVQKLRWHPFIAVIGASGVGKSSLVFAGLAPALKQATVFFGPEPWTVREVRPGEQPLDALRTAFGLAAHADLRALSGGPAAATPHQLLIVDQFEEIFTTGKHEALPFMAQIQELIAQRVCYVVLTVRADFYGDLTQCSLWPEIEAHNYTVAPLTEQGIHEVIARPAEDVNVYIEQGLVERLVAGVVGQPGVLPFAQEMMVRLWAKLERRWLPLRAYDDLFLLRRTATEPAHVGITAAIAEIADGTITGLAPVHQRIAQRILVRLVHYGEGRPNTRRQQAVSDLQASRDTAADFDATLEHLVRSRLVVAGGAQRQRWVDLAHEALLTGWPRLVEWVEKSRADELTRRELERAASLWLAQRGNAGYLYHGDQLQHAAAWVQDHPDDASPRLGDFLAAGQRRARLRTLLQAAAALLALGVAGLLAFYAVRWVQVQSWRAAATGETVAIAGGPAMLGSRNPDAAVYRRAPVMVPPFAIDRHEVTYGQYRLCVQAGACSEPQEAQSQIELATASAKRPVTGVNAPQAAAFCAWVGGRLPSAIEWERAARGAAGRAWPWGETTPTPARVNVYIDAYFAYTPAQTVAVDDPAFAGGATVAPEAGITHLIGNVAEWTRTPLACETDVYTCAAPDWDGRNPTVIGLLIRGLGYTDQLIAGDPDFSIAFTPSDGELSHTKIDLGFRCAREFRGGER